MDPFSIVAGTAGLLDVCIKVSKYLREISVASGTIEGELVVLAGEIDALNATNEAVKRAHLAFTSVNATDATTVHAKPSDIQRVWHETSLLLGQCQSTVHKLKDLLDHVRSPTGGRYAGLKSALKMHSKEKDFAQTRQQLGILKQTLTTNVSLINMLCSQESFEKVSTELRRIHDSLESLKLRANVASFSGADDSIRSLKRLLSRATRNRHFDVPLPVSSIFTGRGALLQVLKGALLDSTSENRVQKRIVVYGIGGSGKTQLCCKFAQEFRESFWGVFWVDATSRTNAKQSFTRIARISGADPNERAAKHWLSNLEHPWLLIIDSADDPSLSLEEYFPEGERGHILVTSRNPDFRIYSTVEPKGVEFTQMEDDEADDLLLHAAAKPSPWEKRMRSSARRISAALGNLPLAILHAGKAILSRACTLENYLDFYHQSWDWLRSLRRSRRLANDDSYLAVYSSYEVICRGLEMKNTETAIQALQLLRAFSFFHHENIKVEILRKAMSVPLKESANQQKPVVDPKVENIKAKKSWMQLMKGGTHVLRALYERHTDASSKVMPSIFQDHDNFDFRLSRALSELSRLSLVTYSQSNDSYNMHSIVHTWVRERPDKTIGDQAIWCQAAINILSRSVSLLSQSSDDDDLDYHRQLLPHVDHALMHRKAINHRFQILKKSQSALRPTISPRFTPTDASCSARLSRVYATCGLWDQAEALQVPVKDYICWMLGGEHDLSHKVQLFLSETLWQLGRGKDAASLQREVVRSSATALGENHPDTLKAMDHLGNSCWLLAQYNESLNLHKKAADGLSALYGPTHVDTLLAKDHLGRVHSKYFHFDEAKRLHHAAMHGLKRSLGMDHLDTLTAMDNLAMCHLDAWQANNTEPLDHAHQLMSEVVESRKKRLGREHPYTLWGTANLARVKSAMGRHGEAEVLFREGLFVAKRNLGEDHIGTLFGRMYFGQDLTRQRRFDEAEAEFSDIIDRHERMAAARNGQHPDRIFTMMLLVECYRAQDRIGEATAICQSALDGLRELGGRGHPFEEVILDELRDLETQGGRIPSSSMMNSATSSGVIVTNWLEQPARQRRIHNPVDGIRYSSTF